MIHVESGLVLVSGPSCGGKSKWAEYLVANQQNVTYIATSAADDTDQLWMNKIEIHKRRRPSHWNTIETTLNLPETITNTNKSQTLLIDSLGGYVCHCLEFNNESWERSATQLISSINHLFKL